MLEYKTKLLIENVLREKLESDKRLLVAQQKDRGCPANVYQKTLDRCGDLEYAIKQMEKLTCT